jgi:hypothetical protein
LGISVFLGQRKLPPLLQNFKMERKNSRSVVSGLPPNFLNKKTNKKQKKIKRYKHKLFLFIYLFIYLYLYLYLLPSLMAPVNGTYFQRIFALDDERSVLTPTW